jgi:sigma-E factor negative regulatory protein RseC
MSYIEHKGIVVAIDDGVLQVEIGNQSACASCHAKGVCSVGDSKDKLIEVDADVRSYKLGEEVNVILERKLGFVALLWGYLMPFILLIVAMIVSAMLTSNELIIGTVSLGILVPYYSLLYLLRNKLKETFSFKIKE